MATSSQQLEELVTHFNRRKQFSHDNLVRVLYISQKTTTMCTDAQYIIVLGEYFPQTLLQEHEYNVNLKLLFNESRLWHIVYQIIQGCAYLEEKTMYHGDLSLLNIYFDANGSIKLMESNITPHGQSAYQRCLISNEFTPLSPELLRILKAGGPESIGAIIDTNLQTKSDVFTLGLLILELASQCPTNQLYNWGEKSFDFNKFNEMTLSITNRGYSNVLKNLILQMCQQSIADQLTFQEIKEQLLPLESDILQYTAFYRSSIR